MADAKISELTAIDAVAAADLLAIVDDPAGTPVTKKATASQIKDYIVALANTWTATQTITPAANTNAIASTGYSLTAANAQSLVDLAGTWNTSGTPTAIKLNITDTASNAASLLLDLQVAGGSKFSVSKTGTITGNVSDISGNNGLLLIKGADTLFIINRFGNSQLLGSLATGANLCATGSLSISSSLVSMGGSGDVILSRRAAANIRLGAADAAAPVAQTLSVQSVVGGTTNTAGANLTITGSQGTGTGAGGSIIFQVAPAGGTGTAQNALATALTIDSTRAATFAGDVTSSASTASFANYVLGATGSIVYSGVGRIKMGATGVMLLLNGAQNDFSRLQFGGTTSAFPALKRASANLQVIGADDAGSAGFIVGNQALNTTATDGFLYVPTCAGTPTGTPTTQTGTVPIVVDTTNNKLYFYSGAAWRDAGP